MDRITINRGSDQDFELEWLEVDPALEARPIDLTTAQDLELFEAHTALVGHVSLSIGGDPTLGIVQGLLTWQDDMLDGNFMHFRVRLSVAGRRRSSHLIQVRVE